MNAAERWALSANNEKDRGTMDNDVSSIKIGDWVTWRSKTRKRYMTGQVVDFYSKRNLMVKIIVTTFDGRGHHWFEPYHKLKKITL